MSEIIKKVSLRDRRIAAERARKLAEMLKQDDVGGAVEFVDGRQYNFLNKSGCARIDYLHRRDLSICLQCEHFDKLSVVCKLARA